MRILLFILFLPFLAMPAGTASLSVDARNVVNSAPGALGLNLNYLLDGSTPASSLTPMRLRYLRYPGGEKSETHLFSVPPWEIAHPTLSRTGPNEWPAGDGTLVNQATGEFIKPPLGFDQFLALCASLGAEPIVVVPFDSAFAPARPPGTAPTLDELQAHAVAWVRYSAGRVHLWEIGNESYLGGWNGSPTATEYAEGVLSFGLAMKAEDASIQIGANGSDAAWWNTVLDRAGPVVSFLSVHNYPVWGWQSYTAYKNDSRTLIYAVEQAAAVLSARRDAQRWIAVTEFGALTWNSWRAINDLGHAILLADMIGQQFSQPRVKLSLLWTTHWSAWNWPVGDTLPEALTPSGGLRPSGHILSLWGEAMEGTQAVATVSSPMVRIYAMRSAGELRLILINKATTSQGINLLVKNFLPASSAVTREQFGGGSPSDMAPVRKWRGNVSISVSKRTITTTLDPVSITILRVKGTAL